MKWFDIQKKVGVDVVDADNENRGQLIVRLIPSMRGHVIRGLDVGVRHMTLGETSTIKVRYDYAYGNFWMGPEIPPRSNINFTVQLLSINGNGKFLQIPWRAFLRFYRMMRRNRRRVKNGCIEFREASLECWKALKLAYHNYRNKGKKDEEESFIEEIEEEEEEMIEQVESEEESDDDEFDVNDNNRGIYVGARAMWGYDPKKRPKKIKKSKAEKKQEKLENAQLERERLEQIENGSGQMSSRSDISKSSRRSRVSIASKSSQQGTRRPSKRDRRHSRNSDNSEDDVKIEYDNDSGSESSSRPSTSISTQSRRKKEAIDEKGRRTAPQRGQPRLTEVKSRK